MARPPQTYVIRFWTNHGTTSLEIQSRNRRTAVQEIQKRFPHAERITATYKGPDPRP